MPQIPLFEPRASVLADDALGRIAYTPGFVSATLARGWFAELQDGVEWKAERRRMYDREVDVPRLTAHYHLAPESADGRTTRTAFPRRACRWASGSAWPSA